MHRALLAALPVTLSLSVFALADGPGDNLVDNVRRIPKLGVEVPAEARAKLEARLGELAAAIDKIKSQATAKKDAATLGLLPDVQVFHRAVADALKHQEFFDLKELDKAYSELDEGLKRATDLAGGKAPWTTASGLVVRGYVSRLDGSVQPYGLVVPESYSAAGGGKFRLDLWFHGRGETLSEVNFVWDRMKNRGQFAPPDTFVLHPYGRYSNAFKLAGEVDVLEALDSVRSRYRIDDERTTVRGFSMGGAAVWHLAVHFPSRWAAANPGAGFSETPDFLRVFQGENLAPLWFEQKLWRMYDCTDWAVNLAHCPTVAYSGEEDKQKQAADIMATALARCGMELRHIIGPKTKHAYHLESARQVDRLMADIVAGGRERTPRRIEFVTYTLKYNQLAWIALEGLGQHWERARVTGELSAANQIELKTENVTALRVNLDAGQAPFNPTQAVTLVIDGVKLEGPRVRSDRSFEAAANKIDGKWQLAGANDATPGIRKRPGLQGPVDDALLDAFVFVKPSGKCQNPAVDAWVQAELSHAIEHWRRHFRGDAVVKTDAEITDADIASRNLVLWGDPTANKLIARIADKLPIRWQGEHVAVGDRQFAAAHHAPILIYPNPLNGQRYVVLNSSFTFREYDYLNNARQTPKLPDWAIVDVRTAPNARWPGKIADADFFDEAWQLKPPHVEPAKVGVKAEEPARPGLRNRVAGRVQAIRQRLAAGKAEAAERLEPWRQALEPAAIWMGERWGEGTTIAIDMGELAWQRLMAPAAAKQPREVVVLLHGLGAHSSLMLPLAWRLEQMGYRVENFAYASLQGPIERHGAKLNAFLARLEADPGIDRIHLVTHSMGGLVARSALATSDREGLLPKKLGRLVMLAPPSRGSSLADQFAWTGWVVPAVPQMGASPASFVNRLPPPPARVEFGVIAATHDLLVPTANTHLAGERDHWEFPGLHSALPLREDVALAVGRFLKDGKFGER